MKKRLDQLLIEKILYVSRTKAQAAIMAGLVFVNGQKQTKVGSPTQDDAVIEIKGQDHPFVGRGGLKLAKALEEFKIDVKDKICLDIGSSTGGFTDCMLQQGAKQVFAVDVGYGQLDWNLRKNPRVKVFERVNARYLTAKDLGLTNNEIQFCAIDVSFISLYLVLAPVYALLAPGAETVALIKPQFEAKREQVGKGGIIKDPKVHDEVIAKVKAAALKIGFHIKGITSSPIEGADGNKEFLLYLVKC